MDPLMALHLLGHDVDAPPRVAPSASSSRILLTSRFVSTGVKDVRVEATAGANVAVSMPLAFADTLRRAWGFGFTAAFPFGDLSVCEVRAAI
jgi:hypothetical protein